MGTLERNNPQPGLLSRRRGEQHQSGDYPSGGELFLLNPFSLMKRVTEEMNRAFGQPGTGTGTAIWSPAIEVTQNAGRLAISAELPGLKPEDVKVNVEDDMLVIEGEREEKKEEEEGGVRRSEIRYGRFYRSIPLPEGAKTEEAQAKFENGVLRIEVPVAEQAPQRRQIPVSGMSGETTGETTGKTTGTGTVETGGKRAA